jgi:energy-coupling factor transporter transmembrane protein EcfT
MMALRAMVVLIAVDGFSSSVSISEVTGLLERSGMRGLGFSVGIAMNLLPSLRLAGRNAWYSLWMRGGLRGRRLHGLKLYLVTVIANTLRRAEEIALAAEARAFTPEKARWLPIKRGALDAPLWAAGILLVIIMFV